MRIHKPSLLLRLLCLLLLLGCVTLPVHADTGPKPSVVVELTGLDGRECWATLLSTTHSTGPHSSIFRPTESGGRERNHNIGYGYPPDVPEYPIVKAFMAYEESDPEELYFLQFVQDCTGTGQFRWGYYPPREFKLLLYFPETDRIVFHQDKNEAIAAAAKTLVSTCATDTFALSFVGQTPAFPLPEGRSRLYLENVTAAELTGVAQQSGVEETETRLVFLTEVHDTRFDVYSVLRPLSAAH